MEEQQYTLWERLQGVLYFADTLQGSIDREDYPAMAQATLSLCPLSSTGKGKKFAQILCRFFSSLEPLRPTWPQRLGQCCQQLESLTDEEYQGLCDRFENQFPQWQRHLTNVTEYLLFRHWHKTVNDDQLYGRAAFISCSTVLLYHLFLTQWAEREALSQADEIAICCAFSREVEHMEENLDLAIDTCAALSPDAIHFPQC